jgi:hypothetical protein
MQVCLDQKLLNAEYGGEILVSLQSAEMQYNIQSNPVPSSVFWTREVQEHFVGDDMKVNSKDWAFSWILKYPNIRVYCTAVKNGGRGRCLICIKEPFYVKVQM